MKSYLLSILIISIVFSGSCKKYDNTDNETPEGKFKQYEGSWLVAETYNGTTINYTTNLTVNSDGSITFSNLSYYHKIITASYNNSASPPHSFAGILVDVSTNTTVQTTAIFFQSNATAKSMSMDMDYEPGSGPTTYSTINATKQ